MIVLFGLLFIIAVVWAVTQHTYCEQCGHSLPVARCPLHQSRLGPPR